MASSSTASPSLESSAGLQDTKAVIFDIDGTLADSWKLGFDATEVVLKNNDIPAITEQLYHECTKYATPERLARHAGLLPGVNDRFEAEGARLAKEFDELYIGLVDTKTAGFFDGIQEILDAIPSNVKLAALTNACVAYAHSVFDVNSPERLANGKGTLSKRFLSVHGADTYVQCQQQNGCVVFCMFVGRLVMPAVFPPASQKHYSDSHISLYCSS